MAQKGATSHLGTATGSTSGREVGVIDYHLSRSISSSWYTPFLSRSRGHNLPRNQVVPWPVELVQLC